MNKKMFTKLFALVLMVCVVFSLAIIVSSAADNEVLVATFELGANGSASHADGSSKTSYTEKDDSYTLEITGGTQMYTGARDAKGNSCIKFGSSSSAGKMTIKVPEGISTVELEIAKYKKSSNAAKITVNGTTYTLSNYSDSGNYDVIRIDTSSATTISFTTVSGATRAMLNTIKFYAAPTTDCTHENTEPVTEAKEPTCTVDGTTAGLKCTNPDCEFVVEKPEVIPALGHTGGQATCKEQAVCERENCGEPYGKLLPHAFENGACTECGEALPAESTISFATNAQRESLSTTQQVWVGNGITFTHTKSTSTTNIADYTNPVRLYKASKIVIDAAAKMSKVVFDVDSGSNSDGTSYVDVLVASIGTVSGATVTKSGTKVTVEYATPAESLTIASLTAQTRIKSFTVTFAEEKEPAEIKEAQVMVGKTLGIMFNVSVPAGVPTMEVDFNGEILDVDNFVDNGDGTYSFVFTGFGAHQMGDYINATLYVDGELADEYYDYSIGENLASIKNKNKDDAELVALVDALLIYGAEAEKYVGKTVDNVFVGDATASDVTPTYNATLTNNGNDDAYIASAKVRYDSTIAIYVKIFVADVENTVVTVNGKAAELIDLGNGYYNVCVNNIVATDFDAAIEVVVGEATLTYSVNDYAAAMQNSEKSASLALALYRYGVAAEAYAA